MSFTALTVTLAHSQTPKDIATKDTSGRELYRHAQFHADQWYRCRDISVPNKNTLASNLVSDKTLDYSACRMKAATRQRHLYAVTVPKTCKTDNIQTVTIVGGNFIVIRLRKTHF